MLILLAAALVIGTLLGLLGGGGSILTVPVLVYLAHLPAKSAIVTSLIVVCISSALTVINFARRKLVCWKTGATFGSAGMVGAYLGGKLAGYIPDAILLVLFAGVMIFVSIAMIFRKGKATETELLEPDNFCPTRLPVSAILFDGILVGLITGLIGVGGGFLLVPALVLLAGLPMQAATGTSLFIIVLQSLAALAGHADHLDIDTELTTLITLCTLIGSFIGAQLTKKINGQYLKRIFGFFVFFLGIFVLYQEISLQLIEQTTQLIIEYQEFLKGALFIIITLLLYRLWSKLH